MSKIFKIHSKRNGPYRRRYSKAVLGGRGKGSNCQSSGLHHPFPDEIFVECVECDVIGHLVRKHSEYVGFMHQKLPTWT